MDYALRTDVRGEATALSVTFVPTLLVAASTHRAGGIVHRFGVLPWRDVALRAREVSNGLLAAGVRAGDSVLLVADGAAQWLVVELGIVAIGAVVLTPPASGRPRLAICGDREDRRKVESTHGDVSTIVIEEHGQRDHDTLDLLAARGVAWAASNLGAADAALAQIGPTSPATVDAAGSMTHEEWSTARSAFGAVDAADRLLPAGSFADRPIRVALHACLLGGGTVVLPDRGLDLSTALNRLEPTVLIAQRDALVDLAAAARRAIEEAGGLRGSLGRQALDGGGLPQRAVARQLARPAIGRTLRRVCSEEALPTDDRDLFRRLGITIGR